MEIDGSIEHSAHELIDLEDGQVSLENGRTIRGITMWLAKGDERFILLKRKRMGEKTMNEDGRNDFTFHHGLYPMVDTA